MKKDFFFSLPPIIRVPLKEKKREGEVSVPTSRLSDDNLCTLYLQFSVLPLSWFCKELNYAQESMKAAAAFPAATGKDCCCHLQSNLWRQLSSQNTWVKRLGCTGLTRCHHCKRQACKGFQVARILLVPQHVPPFDAK